MTTFITNKRRFLAGVLAAGVAGALALAGSSALAAPPYAIVQSSSPVTTAVPGKPFTMHFTVTNTGDDVYSGVKVIFHIPNGMTHSKVSPPNAEILDDIVQWANVPVQANGGKFKPSLTLTLDEGTKLSTKKRIWVEITGDGMEANSQNFSVTAASNVQTSTATSSSSTVVPKINSMHRIVWGRNPTASEHVYWWGRVSDKPTYSALLGAMQYHQLHGIAH